MFVVYLCCLRHVCVVCGMFVFICAMFAFCCDEFSIICASRNRYVVCVFACVVCMYFYLPVLHTLPVQYCSHEGQGKTSGHSQPLVVAVQ